MVICSMTVVQRMKAQEGILHSQIELGLDLDIEKFYKEK